MIQLHMDQLSMQFFYLSYFIFYPGICFELEEKFLSSRAENELRIFYSITLINLPVTIKFHKVIIINYRSLMRSAIEFIEDLRGRELTTTELRRRITRNLQDLEPDF